MRQTNYRDIFEKLEQSFKDFNGLSAIEYESTFARFNTNKFGHRTDNAYFELLKMIPFYSGFKAVTVENKKPVIDKHFPDFSSIALYDEGRKGQILIDKDMIKSKSKINATVSNALAFRNIISCYGSFQQYLESFRVEESFENLMLIKEDLQSRFQYLGGITVYHFMTDIGLNVLKPDRVITRIFNRLGLITQENQLLQTVIHGRKFAAATGKTIRYIDIVLVKYGQRGKSLELKVKDGICLEESPKCHVCGVKSYCRYYNQIHTALK